MAALKACAGVCCTGSGSTTGFHWRLGGSGVGGGSSTSDSGSGAVGAGAGKDSTMMRGLFFAPGGRPRFLAAGSISGISGGIGDDFRDIGNNVRDIGYSHLCHLYIHIFIHTGRG